MLGTYTGEKLQLDFRSRLFRHVQRLSLAYPRCARHDRLALPDPVRRAVIQWIAVHGMTPFLTAGLTLAGMVYVTARIDRQLALVALAIVPVLVVLTWASRKRLRPGWREAKDLESSAMSVVQEALGASCAS